MNLDLNLDLKTGVPLGEVLRASLLRHKNQLVMTQPLSSTVSNLLWTKPIA